MSLNSDKSPLPLDFYYSGNGTVGNAMAQIHSMVSLDVFRSIPRMSCGDVDDMLGKLQNESLHRLVSQLRDIAGENSHFADNWVTADIPSVILPKTLVYILNFAPFNDAEMNKLGEIIEHGIKNDPFQFDGRVMSLLCGRHFPVELREEMYKLAQTLPFKIRKRYRWEHILSSFFAGEKEEGQSTVPFSSVLAQMEWAVEQYKKGTPYSLSDVVFSSFLSHPGITFDKLSEYFSLAKSLRMANLKVYNARNKKIVFDESIDVNLYIEPPGDLLMHADERQKAEYYRIEGAMLLRKKR